MRREGERQAIMGARAATEVDNEVQNMTRAQEVSGNARVSLRHAALRHARMQHAQR